MSAFTDDELEYLVPSGGKAFGERFEDTIVRIQPTRIISFGIGPGETANARSVGVE
jgi:hypothetical protein